MGFEPWSVEVCCVLCLYCEVWSSFLISVCMFIMSKALLISSATLIVRAGGAIWLLLCYLVCVVPSL